MTVNEVLKLLTEKPKLLRRPILIDRNKLVIGYNPGELMKLTKKKRYINLYHKRKTKIR